VKAHPWLREEDRERLCRLLDCPKLSLEACSHAAQNERLPLRTIVQVLFFEQSQLRTVIASYFMIDDERSLPDNGGNVHGVSLVRPPDCSAALREHHALRADMEHMKKCILKLERECSDMREELRKLGKPRASTIYLPNPRTFGFKLKSQICRSKAGRSNADGNPKDSCRKHIKHHQPDLTV
jgi:hypothetical protein